MQHFKGIENLSEIKRSCSTVDLLSDNFARALKAFDLSSINKHFKDSKIKGISAPHVFKILFLFPFIDILNIRALFLSGYSFAIGAKKDVFYTFQNNPRIPWRKIVFLLARQFLQIVEKKSVDEKIQSPKCLIIDDSLIEKTPKMY